MGVSAGQMREDPRYTNVTVLPRCNYTVLTLLSLCSGLSPEIVHFRIESDGISDSSAPQDWDTKRAACVPLSPWGRPRGLGHCVTAPGTQYRTMHDTSFGDQSYPSSLAVGYTEEFFVSF